MSLAEVVPIVDTLSRQEKYELARRLVEELADRDSSVQFKLDQVYPIHTPTFSPDAASQLAQALKDFEHQA